MEASLGFLELENASLVINGQRNLTEDSAMTTGAATTKWINNEVYLKNERLVEGMYLMMLAICGTSLNFVVLSLVFICKPLRSYMNGFIVHGCVLDMLKSAMCIPYALAMLQITHPTESQCYALGLSYIVLLTVSMFNLLAMVMAEAYAFHERNVSNGDKDRGNGAAMCIIFGVITIYIGSIILHLGPTLIGGEFKFNKDVGNCMFAYGEIQNFIVQAIWIIIVTSTMGVLFRYIYKFYRQLKANQRFRITNLARNAAAYTRGQYPDDDIYEMINKLKNRVKVLFAMALSYCLCWYPLFFLSLFDYKYNQPKYLYRVLTVIAWSHSAIMPIILLSIDRSFGIFHQIRKALGEQRRRKNTSSPSTQPLTRDDSTIQGSQHTSLYNHTMNTEGQAIRYTDSPKTNSQGYKVTVVDRGITDKPPNSPAHISTRLLSDYDDLSLEESPL